MVTRRQDPIPHLVVMGVSGVGKSTIAQLLAHRLGWEFGEGDEFHPRSNVAKMTAGVPLTDEDRAPWLEDLVLWTSKHDADREPTVLSCSALRRRDRDALAAGLPGTFFVHLDVDAETLLGRLDGREHFMPAGLLQSQIDTLEPLEPDEPGRCFDAGLPPERTVKAILAELDVHSTAYGDSVARTAGFRAV